MAGEKTFKEFYNGDEHSLVEDLELLRALKRQITSYLRETSQERLHGIFNKIFIIRKSMDRSDFYDVILSEMNDPEKEKFMKFLLYEGFSYGNKDEIITEDIWHLQLSRILKQYNKNKKGV